MEIRKRRTRQHVIADLSHNHFERFVLRCGHTVKRISADYGYDAWVQTFNDDGEQEPGYVLVQLKSSDSPNWLADRSALSVVLSRADLHTWADETNEVVLAYYDASADRAYWLSLTDSALDDILRIRSARDITLRIPATNVIDEAAIRNMRTRKLLRVQGIKQRGNQ